jgi:chromosomal replication initiator protein
MESCAELVSITDVQRAVARAFRLGLGEMLSRARHNRVACARQVAMYLCRELAGGPAGRRRSAASFPRIGKAFARDHTSVIHACNVVARRRVAEAGFAQLLDTIVRDLNAASKTPQAA